MRFEAIPPIEAGLAWGTSNAEARAGYLSSRAMDRYERLMAVPWPRMIETPKRVSERAEALALRKAGGTVQCSISRGW